MRRVLERWVLMIAFGPVPSRRLGRSLGINNIPPKLCPYSCVYCQLGRTLQQHIDRQTFWQPEELVAVVREKVTACQESGEPIDYLAFVPDGEPTLDANLGRTIDALRPLGIRIAVISNASLIDREDVRTDLAKADWVSLKVDAAREPTWRRVDRPNRKLRFSSLLDGMRAFSKRFDGELTTETMLIAGVNDAADDVRATAELVGELSPSLAYLAVPTRPPAEAWVEPATEESMAQAYAIFQSSHDHVELLVGYEGDAFSATGDAKEDLLSITAVHPMREGAVRKLIDHAGAQWELVGELVRQGQLIETRFGPHVYYLRPIKRPDSMRVGEG